MTWDVKQGDVREVLRTLPEESVQCCVTSPPYFGLRDYKVDGQLGLEKTPEEYVAKMVEVFREVKRVLRDDGTCFINLGDSYFGSNKGMGADGKAYAGPKQSTNRGSVGVPRVAESGNDDKVLSGSSSHGSSSENLCGECADVRSLSSPDSGTRRASKRAVLSSESIRARRESPPDHPDSSHSISQADRTVNATSDLVPSEGHADMPLHASQPSTIGESSSLSLDECLHCANCGVCLSVVGSSMRDGRLCARKRDGNSGRIGNLSASVSYTSGKVRSGDPYQYCTTAYLKPKDLVGIPWRIAFALQADGWYLRSDIIWCLSGGAWLYAKTQHKEGPMMLRDLARLKPATVQLWTGKKWTNVKRWQKTSRPQKSAEIVLRSGERIGCTFDHWWPTKRGLFKTSELRPGDAIETTLLPRPDLVDCPMGLPEEYVGFFVGLYLAEGSRSEDTIQIACHKKETWLYTELRTIAEFFGGTCRRHEIGGNAATVNLNGKILNAILDTYLDGRTAKDKRLSMACWKRNNAFLDWILTGYLQGDGAWEEKNKRWRLGFTRNYGLELSLRTLCARLDYTLTLKPATAKYQGGKKPIFRGELRKSPTEHWNRKDRNEIVEIRLSRAREFYHVEVEDAPYLFALASGVLTHNSKPNPMPESVRDRPTKAHEYLFLLTKCADYYYDAQAIAEPSVWAEHDARADGRGKKPSQGKCRSGEYAIDGVSYGRPVNGIFLKNKRTVWEIPTQSFAEAHFATFPEKLVELCVRAGTSEKGCCAKCGAPWERLIDTPEWYKQLDGHKMPSGNLERGVNAGFGAKKDSVTKPSFTVGWHPTCSCQADTQPCLVLDPFCGSGTTGVVALKLQRNFLGIELQPDYVAMAKRRMSGVMPLFAGASASKRLP